MPELPAALEDWDFDTIRSIVGERTYEARQFDFKSHLTYQGDRKEEMHANLLRTVCSMANTDTGYIIFGVQDRRVEVAKSEDRIIGIPSKGDHTKEFGEKIQSIDPDVGFDAIPSPIFLPADSTRCVFVVRIPLSPQRPHQYTRDGVFYRRGEGGLAVRMSRSEVRDQLFHTESLMQQVRLARLKLMQWESLADTISDFDAKSLRSCYARFENESFEVLLASICGALPKDSGLLEDMLANSVIAQELNQAWSRWQINDFYGHRLQSDTPEATQWASEVNVVAGILRDGCKSSQSKLEEVFGPL